MVYTCGAAPLDVYAADSCVRVREDERMRKGFKPRRSDISEAQPHVHVRHEQDDRDAVEREGEAAGGDGRRSRALAVPTVAQAPPSGGVSTAEAAVGGDSGLLELALPLHVSPGGGLRVPFGACASLLPVILDLLDGGARACAYRRQ